MVFFAAPLSGWVYRPVGWYFVSLKGDENHACYGNYLEKLLSSVWGS